MPKYLSVSEAAEKLNVNSETLRRWDKSGKFKSLRHPINNYRVYSEEQVLSLVEEMQMEITYRKRGVLSNKYVTYFETNLGKLYNADSLEFLQTLGPGSIDLIFADPPYNIKKAEWDSFSSQKAYVEWSLEWITEASRILKNTGSLYICGFSEILADVKWASALCPSVQRV